MSASRALSIVESYYKAFRNKEPSAVSTALGDVFHAEIVIESPMVDHKYGAPLRGHEAALPAAVSMAPYLKNVTVESCYASPDGTGVAALINFPTPVGNIVQSEHFEVEPATGKIKRLRSYYDPRKLLPPGA